MKSKYAEKFKTGAAPFLDDGEEVLSACIAQPKGRTRAAAGGGGVVREMGLRQQRANAAAGEEAGLITAAPMALALTNKRLATFKISTPVLGRGGDVKELLSAIPLADVEAFEVKRVGLGQRITVTVAGIVVELEAAAGGKEVHEAYQRAKAG
jgi:hypothetical protein